MKALFLALNLLLGLNYVYAKDAQKVCLFKDECWVEMVQEDNKELVDAIKVINKESLESIKFAEAQGNVWFKAYKRESKYNTRSLKPTSLNEATVRTLLDNGSKFFVGSDYEDMLTRYDMGSDFFTDIISFYKAIKSHDNDSLSGPLDFEAYYYDYSNDEENKVKLVESELNIVSKFIKQQAKADKWESLVTVDFTNALYNENYEYRPYLLVTDKYVFAALYRWQL